MHNRVYGPFDVAGHGGSVIMAGKRQYGLAANRFKSEYAMSYKEIGAELGMSHRTVEEICLRALAKLRKTPGALRELRELIQMRRKLQDERENK